MCVARYVRAMTFAELLALWPSPKQLAAVLDVQYDIARGILTRGKAAPPHWRALCRGYAEKFPEFPPLTLDDILDMWIEAEDRPERESRQSELARIAAEREANKVERERRRREAAREARIAARRLAAQERRTTKSG